MKGRGARSWDAGFKQTRGWERRRGWGPEDHIQADIVHALREALPKSCLVMAIPNGADLTKAARGKLFGALGAVAGAHDLFVFWHGGMATLEVKAPGKYLRPEQRVFAAKLEALGISSAMVRSVDEAFAALIELGAPLRVKTARAA